MGFATTHLHVCWRRVMGRWAPRPSLGPVRWVQHSLPSSRQCMLHKLSMNKRHINGREDNMTMVRRWPKWWKTLTPHKLFSPQPGHSHPGFAGFVRKPHISNPNILNGALITYANKLEWEREQVLLADEAGWSEDLWPEPIVYFMSDSDSEPDPDCDIDTSDESG